MRLDRFDLNLLVALDALIEERSVTGAAQRLHVTQPAISASLQRLRDALGDPLLVRQGRAMVPTPAALALAPEVKDLLGRIRRLVEPASDFDPATSLRTFRIVASDYIATLLLAPLSRRLEREAPSVRIAVELPGDGSASSLSRGEVDLVLTPEQFADPQHPSVLLFEERHSVVGCAHNPLLAGPVTPEIFATCGHVAVQIDGHNSYIENELSRLGIERRIEVQTASFLQAAWFLPGTSRLALMHERLGHHLAPMLGLFVKQPPFAFSAMREMMQFHSGQREDPALQWLMQRLVDTAENASIWTDQFSKLDRPNARSQRISITSCTEGSV